MWELRNGTSFAADRTIVIDTNGARGWVVIVKGTFDILPNGELEIAEEQIPPTMIPEYYGDDGESSLRYEQDMISSKPGTDVYVNASAYAPGGRPTSQVAVGLKMPWGQKTLNVVGDRVWERNAVGLIEPSLPTPFVNMPIVYERALGGYDKQDPDESKHRLDPRNPVGTGFFTRAAHRRDQPLPNIEWPGKGMEGPPAGFGALSSFWEPRIKLHGTFDEQWVKERKPLVPKDYDPRCLQCAPEDQQVHPHLRGGESFGVVNMNPTRAAIDFAVPKHYFGFTTAIGQKRLEHRAKINTIVIEPGVPRVLVVWHSLLECHHDLDDIDFTLIKEKRYV